MKLRAYLVSVALCTLTGSASKPCIDMEPNTCRLNNVDENITIMIIVIPLSGIDIEALGVPLAL